MNEQLARWMLVVDIAILAVLCYDVYLSAQNLQHNQEARR